MTTGTPEGGCDALQAHEAKAVRERVLSGAPEDSFEVPAPLARLFPQGVDAVVWRNEAGGVTVRGSMRGHTVYAKWAPPEAAQELNLRDEAERLAWAHRFLCVPEVIDLIVGDDGEVLVTRALPGENAVVPRWIAEPETAVRALAKGLRVLHDTLPVAECPFSWTADDRIARGRSEGVAGRIELLDALGPAPQLDRLVVCHADACAPNTLLAEDGTVSGYVDLGRLGIGDRWADVAIGAWSTVWNYGDGYESLYYVAYGVEPDEERIAYYRALWDAT